LNWGGGRPPNRHALSGESIARAALCDFGQPLLTYHRAHGYPGVWRYCHPELLSDWIRFRFLGGSPIMGAESGSQQLGAQTCKTPARPAARPRRMLGHYPLLLSLFKICGFCEKSRQIQAPHGGSRKKAHCVELVITRKLHSDRLLEAPPSACRLRKRSRCTQAVPTAHDACLLAGAGICL
jgi:hypothetical protein